ncbi:MAG TPA: OmpA family protein [Vicinamibacterales bacterium]|nr:OmpA family protein [Vicinamibacterales bacterium]
MRPPRRTGRPPSHDRWLIPYADFVTLLFAFFTALYAVTAVDATRLPGIAEGLRAAVGASALTSPGSDAGVLPGGDALLTPEPPPQLHARETIERELREDLAAERLELVEDRRGLVLAVPEAFSFETGRADLSGAAAGLMGRVAGVLETLPNAVRIEGHTDNTPIHTPRFTSNWDLSTARATEVVAFFIDSGLMPDRLSAAGYSEYHPRAGNDTPEGRARNRRVDIIILNEATRASEEPAATGAVP